jgi:hypothetical protein
MPKKTPLQAAAAEADDAQTKKKARGVLASLAALLGVGGNEAQPSAKMSKRTETTKHTIVEEDDSDDAEEESEEEEEEMGSETDMTGSDADSEASSAAEEEEEEEEASAESEEEEERAQARAIANAYKAPAVKEAFLAAVPAKYRPSAALRAPDRLAREMKRATGAKTIDDAMTALSRSRKTAADGGAKVIKAQAELAARVTKVETESRKQRVDAMVDAAKAAGKAPTKALRAQLREHGNAHGTKALGALIASLPVVARTSAKLPKHDEQGNPLGGPTADAQAMERAMFAHITDPKERAATIAEYRAKLAERTNASGGDA